MRTKKSGQSALLLLDVIDILTRKKIPYAVIGAFAASVYGIVRASMDADAIISLAVTAISAQDLTVIFNKLGLSADYHAGDFADPLEGVIKIHDRHNNQVDLITGIKGMDSGVFTRTIRVNFLKQKICFIGIEDFIAMKIFAGSPKDIDDARNALNVSKKLVNDKLLEKFTAGYGKKEVKILSALMKE
jgi:hypothetical protein